ncbi:hypothetical protein BDF19DRAFT_416248 [Syncephalis fuscata]|nr:hypothetical protein BDF19DRAFT_416248 [Syncephalis fuscata]
MSANKDPVQLYAAMDASIADNDYDRVLVICNQLLDLDKQDTDALRAKLVTLIRLDRYHEALKFLDTVMPPAMARERVFERAYSLYRLEKLSEVQALFKTVDVTTSLPLTHLKAQVAYKTEDFPTAVKLYNVLVDNTEKDNANYADLLANLIAAKAATLASGGKLSDKLLQVNRDQLETYDQIYNAATLSIANGQLAAAETLLCKARDTCRSSLREQEYTDKEIEAELATIMHSWPTCASCWVRRRKHLYTNKRFWMQTNRAIMQLWLKKYSAARDAAKRLSSHQPNWSIPHLISAAAPYCQGKKQRAIDELTNALAQNSSLLEVRLVLARMAAKSGDIAKAIELLHAHEKDPSCYDAASLETMVKVYEIAGQKDTARTILENALDYYKRHNDQKGINSVLKLRGALCLRAGKAEQAVQDYTALVKADPDDKKTLANLVMACAEYKPELAKNYTGVLVTPPVRPGQTSNAELNALESRAPGVSRRVAASTTTASRSSAPKSAPIKKKKRSNPPAKSYDAEKQPDPERWLPKRERSDFKPKGRKRGAASKLASGPQGLSLPGSGGGGTGSARIDGKSAQVSMDIDTSTTSDMTPTNSSTGKATSSKKKKSGGKGKGKGKGKW